MNLGILVADDDPLMAEDVEATDGTEALTLLQEDRFDFLLGRDMPGKNGPEVC